MTPHYARRGKSLRIDRVFVGVGRIALASGTDHLPTFKRINAMLTGLYKIGRLDILAAIKDGTHAPLTVLHLYERGQLDKLPTKEATVELVDALWKFQKTHECGVSYRSDLGTSVRHIERALGKKAAPVTALPALLRTMKDSFRDRPVAFNRLRTHCLAFAGEHAGELSPLWIEVRRVRRFKKAEGVRKRKLLRRPLTVAELDLVCAAFTDHTVHGGRKGMGNKGRLVVRRVILAADLAQMTRVLATTGMRPQEYWERNGATWIPRPDHVWVNGTKTAAAVRPTFRLVDWPWRPACGEQFFRAALATATEKALRVGLDAYSLRRTFASLCEDARVVESRAKAYLGHGPKDVTDIYLRTNVLPFVEQDAAQVSAWIEAERTRTVARPSLKLEGGR